MFFVLSGYLITSMLINKKRGVKIKPYLSSFFTKRILRLFPLYFFYIFLLCLAYFVFKKPEPFPIALPFLLTYTLNFARMSPHFIGNETFVHLWSLAAEWQYYLILPFIVYFTTRRTLFRLLILFIILAPLLRFVTWQFGSNFDWGIDGVGRLERIGEFVYNAPWSYLDAFSFGGLLVFPKAVNFFKKKLVITVAFASVLVSGIGMLLFYHNKGLAYRSLGWRVDLPYGYQSIWGYTLLSAAAACLISMVLEQNKILSNLLNHRWLHHVGKISYGVYVYHFIIVYFMLRIFVKEDCIYSLKSFLYLLVACAVSIGIAHVSYTHFEIRFLRIKNQIK
jgi:peptidoglycan/LPS O-acetylase OafA/YrhL